MSTLIQLAHEHKAAIVLAFGWFIRELHNVWAFLQGNGGLIGLYGIVMNGNLKTISPTTNPPGESGTK